MPAFSDVSRGRMVSEVEPTGRGGTHQARTRDQRPHPARGVGRG